MSVKIHFSIVLALLLGFLAGGCNEPAEAPSPPTSPRKAVASADGTGKIDVVEEPKAVEPVYVYNPAGRRDPFASPLMVRQAVPIDDHVPPTPLQNYDLSQLRLTGMIVGLKQPKAMVVSPDGKNFIVGVGTKIGKNNGTVVEINRDGVLVEEVYYDFSGEIRKNIQPLLLPKREGVR